MVGKMSTTMRVTERTPISMMSIAAIAIVYGRRSAIFTRLIMLAVVSRQRSPVDLLVCIPLVDRPRRRTRN